MEQIQFFKENEKKNRLAEKQDRKDNECKEPQKGITSHKRLSFSWLLRHKIGDLSVH